MSDKRLLPLTLPLGLLDEPEHQELVKQHWNVTFARQGKMSVTAKRIMARVLDQIRDDDYALRPFFQLKVSDIVEEAGITKKTAQREIESSLLELGAAIWVFKSLESEEGEADKWYMCHLLDTTKKTRVGYENGVITIILNPELSPYFIQIAHYTKYKLSNYMSLRSWYSMRFFEILSAFTDTGFWEVDIEEYRHLMDCGQILDKRQRPKRNKKGELLVKYPNISDLIHRTTTEPLQELAGTELAFKFEPVYEADRVGPGRKKIIRFRFELLKKPLTAIPPSWLENRNTRTVIENLRKWRVSDKNIALYAPILRQKGANKLLHEWMLKQTSDKRIDNLEKYCNAAFVRAAKTQREADRAEALAVRAHLKQQNPQQKLFDAEEKA